MTIDRKLKFVSALELPPQGHVHATRMFDAAPLASARGKLSTDDSIAMSDPGQPSGFVNNGSLVSFLAGIDRQSQADVLNSMLLAQLAANKQFDREQDIVGWYGFYHEVLENLGWVVQQFAFDKYDVAGRTAKVDQVVIELLAALASDDAAAVAKSTIDALKALSADDHRLVIFSQSSHSVQNGNFQVSTCSSEGDVLTMSLGAFHFSSTQVDTKVLFFDWSTSNTSIHRAGQSIVLDREAYGLVRDTVVQKLGEHARTFVGALDL